MISTIRKWVMLYIVALALITGKLVAEGVKLKYSSIQNNASFTIRLLSSFSTPSPVTGISVNNNYAYVNTSGNGMFVVDISDSTNPVEIGHCDLPGNGGVLKQRGNYVYTVNWDAGLRIISVSDPTSPQEVGYIDTDGHSQDLFVDDTLAYIADRENGVVIVNVSNPRTPNIVYNYSTPYWTRGLTVNDQVAYVGLRNYTLSVLDVSTPDSIHEIANVQLPGEPRGVSIYNNLLFVSCRYGGLSVLDISDINNIHQIANYDNGNYVMWSIEELPFIYILNENSLEILSMQDTSFTQLESLTFDQSAYAIYKRDNLIFVGLQHGLYIYEVTGVGVNEKFEEDSKLNGLSFYRNKNVLKIVANSATSEHIDIEIFKVNGSLIFRNVISGGTSCIYRFPTTGIFLIRWKLDRQESWNYKKFVIVY